MMRTKSKFNSIFFGLVQVTKTIANSHKLRYIYIEHNTNAYIGSKLW